MTLTFKILALTDFVDPNEQFVDCAWMCYQNKQKSTHPTGQAGSSELQVHFILLWWRMLTGSETGSRSFLPEIWGTPGLTSSAPSQQTLWPSTSPLLTPSFFLSRPISLRDRLTVAASFRVTSPTLLLTCSMRAFVCFGILASALRLQAPALARKASLCITSATSGQTPLSLTPPVASSTLLSPFTSSFWSLISL